MLVFFSFIAFNFFTFFDHVPFLLKEFQSMRMATCLCNIFLFFQKKRELFYEKSTILLVNNKLLLKSLIEIWVATLVCLLINSSYWRHIQGHVFFSNSKVVGLISLSSIIVLRFRNYVTVIENYIFLLLSLPWLASFLLRKLRFLK